MEQCDDSSKRPLGMDRHLDVLRCQEDGGLLLGASCLTGRYWLGSLWFYQSPDHAPDVDKCTAGVQLEAGVSDARWVDGTHVIVALDTGGIALWSLVDDCRTFLLSYSAPGHDDVATCVSVTSDKDKAVSCSYDRCVKEWDLSNMSLLSSYRAHTDMVTCTDCHPTEPHMFVSCAQDGKLLLWDKRKPKPASILQTSPLTSVPTCVQWQPGDAHKMGVGSESGQFALLDTRMGVENYLTAAPHRRPIYRLQFSPNEPSTLATVSEDCRTAVSSIDEDGVKLLYSDKTHTDFVHGLSWSHTSSSSSPSPSSELYTCSWDSRVLCHNVSRQTATILGECGSSNQSQQCDAPVPMNVNGGGGDEEATTTTDDKEGGNGDGDGDGSHDLVRKTAKGKGLVNGGASNTNPANSYSKVLQNGNGNSQDMEA